VTTEQADTIFGNSFSFPSQIAVQESQVGRWEDTMENSDVTWKWGIDLLNETTSLFSSENDDT
jgi:hypothetical protein